ncbi:spore germination protein GerW family protein [Hymenobacter sp. BT770]|uniref:spore germination protein GerW family protein n=1 Tax=Hymenobacter sp. BT770 TaxID=2886942 RepID=UPI001D1059E6|nr:spore germination protein GerW family protein [Hymenobacter sp. BT770]MCC3155324.1 hypothetical protein [Hymenobacter sp. BT770]MDO3417357.1 spore germination protein GerW family protein [Hymenobacter sp. BT770]
MNPNEITTTTAPSLAERLAQVLSHSVRTEAVYGNPVERNGVTVIPVARAYYGFGGGSGTNAKSEAGTGGGGGATINPVGYIEMKDGRTNFRPIRSSVVPLVAVSGLVAYMLMRSMPRMRARRRIDNANWVGDVSE